MSFSIVPSVLFGILRETNTRSIVAFSSTEVLQELLTSPRFSQLNLPDLSNSARVLSIDFNTAPDLSPELYAFANVLRTWLEMRTFDPSNQDLWSEAVDEVFISSVSTSILSELFLLGEVMTLLDLCHTAETRAGNWVTPDFGRIQTFFSSPATHLVRAFSNDVGSPRLDRITWLVRVICLFFGFPPVIEVSADGSTVIALSLFRTASDPIISASLDIRVDSRRVVLSPAVRSDADSSTGGIRVEGQIEGIEIIFLLVPPYLEFAVPSLRINGALSLDFSAILRRNPLFSWRPREEVTVAGENLLLSFRAEAAPVARTSLSLSLRQLNVHVASFDLRVREIKFGLQSIRSGLEFITEIVGGVIRLSAESLGGFLRSILQDDLAIEFGFRLSAGNRGVAIEGGIGVEISIARSLQLGPIVVNGIRIKLAISTSGIQLAARAVIVAELGPITLAVTGVGGMLLLSTDNLPGNLGICNISGEFIAPNGIAASVDSSLVTGGGFISYDAQNGRYVGAVALDVCGVSVRALGLLDTRVQTSSGYSFIVIISAEFTPVQIGFGFTLNGVGGLCGVHRSANVDALKSGVRDGSLLPMLFLRNPIAQASRITSTIATIFPVAEDSFVFGPIVKLGWGTPTLVTVTVGLIIQLPSPVIIALIGLVEVRLPRPESAVIEINIDILGVLYPERKFLSIEARLRNSKVAGWTLTGGMVFQLCWGEDPLFLFSVGGFNPNFRPPPNFPRIDRLALSLGTGSNPRVSLAAYFAVTSNSLQFGARAELYAGAAGFSLQGYLEFHALFIFSPFSFRFDFAAGFALKAGSSVLAGISVAGTLSGPRPWRIRGSASITLLFFDVSVSFDETFGDPPEREQIAAVDVWPKLTEAVRDLRSWTALTPPGASRGVSTAASAEAPAQIRLDPLGGLSVRQKVLPFERRLAKLGEAPLEGGPSTFRIVALRAGGTADRATGQAITARSVTDAFAAGQYEPLSDTERLSRPSFEPMTAGVEALSQNVRAMGGIAFERRWSTVMMESDEDTAPATAMDRAASAGLRAFSAARRRGTASGGLGAYGPPPGARPKVRLAPETWAVASRADLRRAPNTAPTAAYGAAERNRADAEQTTDDTWQVVPAWEVA